MNLPAFYPAANRRMIPEGRYGGLLVDPIGVIYHVQVGNGSLFREFSESDDVKSAHLWVAKTGGIEQYVRLDRVAYAQRRGNSQWVSVEFEGYPSEPYTDAQITQAALFYQWCMETTAWPLQITDNIYQSGIGTHSMGGTAWGAHACPGDIRARQRTEIVERVKELSDLSESQLRAISEATWNAPVVQISGAHPVRQPDMRHVTEQAYLKTGDLQSRMTVVELLVMAIAREMGIDVSTILNDEIMIREFDALRKSAE